MKEYDSIDFLKDSCDKNELISIQDVIENEFEDVRDEILEIFESTSIHLDFSKDNLKNDLYQQVYFQIDKLQTLIDNLIDAELNYIEERFKR